jgi:hypothetical protein
MMSTSVAHNALVATERSGLSTQGGMTGKPDVRWHIVIASTRMTIHSRDDDCCMKREKNQDGGMIQILLVFVTYTLVQSRFANGP